MRLQAALAVNQELIVLYWVSAREILEPQVPRDRPRRDFPDMTGLSARNLKYMRMFAETHRGSSESCDKRLCR